MAEDGKKQDPRTVFVRGIDASVTDEALQEFFSEIGPVKKAFLVKRGKDGPHRGFGFVQFAIQDDAARAAADLHGKELAGRKLKVEGAVKRPSFEERKKRKQEAAVAPPQQQQQEDQQPDEPAAGTAVAQPPAAKKPRRAQPAAKADPAAAAAAEAKHKWVRTVAVGGLTQETLAAAMQMARAAGEVEELIEAVPDGMASKYMLKRDGCSGEAFLAVYKTVKQATDAVTKLHGQTAGGGRGQGGKKGGKGAAAAGCRIWARQLSGDGLHHKRWRVIVRNLPFTTTEDHMRKAFAPAGFVWELTLPRSTSGRGRGFAFVGFTCRTHAERAIKLVNGTAIAGRPVAVDWALSKAQYGPAQREDGGQEAPASLDEKLAGLRQQEIAEALGLDSDDEGAGPPAALGHEEEDAGAVAAVEPEQERRMLASVIDGILSSDDEGDEAGDDVDAASGELGGSEEEGEASDGEPGDSEDSGADSGLRSAEGEGGSGEAEGGAEAAGVAQQGAAAADPFSRKQLQEKATAAAAAGAAAVQQPTRPPPEEGATVFIRGLPLDVTKEQVFTKMKAYGPVRSCRLVVDKTSGKLKGTAFVDFYTRAAADKAAEACAKGRLKQGPGVVIAGRVADVDLALGQQDVRALAAAKAAERGPRDSRRLALAKEGQIAEGSPAWEDMAAGDRAKRKRAAEEKKLKLRSPNFVVSDTRLSVRNIPPSWTEKQLKACFIAAVKQRAKQAAPVVRQAKILVDEERAGVDGTPRSKGIGFVEFTDHEHALCALRQLNNNPAAFTKDKRPIVEFALENIKALKLREAKIAKQRQQQQQKQQQGEEAGQQEAAAGNAAAGARATATQREQAGSEGEREGEEGEPPAPKSKRQLRKERRLMLKERRKQQAEEEGTGVGASNGDAAQGEKSRAAKRREQRKRKLEGQPGAAAGAAQAAPEGSAPAAAASRPVPAAQGAGPKKQQQQRPAQLGVNTRAAKSQAASQLEQQARQRKRSADELIDRLADAEPAGELRARKARKKEATDNVDRLAKQYLAKLFDAPAASKKGGPKASAGAAMKRWFD